MSETKDALLEALEVKRDGYDDERDWHRFLLDAYAGTGGFQGRVRQPFASWWGAAADMYSSPPAMRGGIPTSGDEQQIETYLDRYAREDVPKFQRRAASSCYQNLIETIVDIRLSYMARKTFQRDYGNAEEMLSEWLNDVDGAATWEELRRDVIDVRSAVLGWCPVLIDVDAMPQGATTRAQVDASGVRVAPRAIPLFPAHLFDWSCDSSGQFAWVKTCVEWTERDSPFAPVTCVRRFTVWGRLAAEWWEYARDIDQDKWTLRASSVQPYGGALEGNGRVPIVVFKHKPVPQDHVRGLSMIGSAAGMARRLFNTQSELDEHMKSCAFGILQVPMKRENGSQIGEIIIGAGNALPIDPDWKNEYKWITPESGVADSFEKRCEALEKQIHRLGRIEFTRATTGSAASGVSRSYEFESTNRAIGDFAAQLAKGDQQVYRLVALREGVKDTSGIRSVAPTKFDVEEMAKELEEATAAIFDVKLGARATAEIRKRVARKMLPNASDKILEEVDEEIDELSSEETAMRAMTAEMAAAGANADSGAEPDAEPDPTTEPDPAAKPKPGEKPRGPVRKSVRKP